MKSISRELITILLFGTGAILVLSGVFLHAAVKRSLIETFDEATLVRIERVSTLVELDREGMSFETDEPIPEFDVGDEAEYFQLWLEDGQRLLRSPSLEDGELALPEQYGDEPVHFDLVLPDGRPGRASGVLVEPALDIEEEEDEVGAPRSRAELLGYEPPRILIVVARSLEEPMQNLAAIRNWLLLAGGLGALAVVGLVIWAVPRRLRPVVKLGNRVQEIDASSLSTRLPESGIPAELSELPRKINQLLSRLEESFDRERRMTANLAHDLRTPLAELRSAVEVSRRWPEDRDLNEQALETAHSASMQMSTLVSALLKLARIEANQSAPETEAVGLSRLVDQLWNTLARNASERNISFENRVDAEATVRTDRALLSLALINLLDNAVKYSPEGTVIHCDASRDAEGVTWSLSNPATNLEQGDLDHLTEPFWQKDRARSRRDGSGLGLSLANTIVSVLGVRLSLDLQRHEFSARLRFQS